MIRRIFLTYKFEKKQFVNALRILCKFAEKLSPCHIKPEGKKHSDPENYYIFVKTLAW